jgi:type II secretory pathway component PulL
MKFRNNRQLEEKKIEQEVTDEWEKKLQVLTEKYEEDLKRKKDKNLERVMIIFVLLLLSLFELYSLFIFRN